MTAVAFYRAPQVPLALLGAAQVAPPPGISGTWTFQIALDAAHVDEWLGEYRERLYWMIGGGTALIGLLGWFITRQGLHPLRQITSAIKEVTANEMDRQLDVERWPAELAVLAREFDDMLRRLRDAFDRQARFSADVAHEFRTPLNNLMGSTSLTLSQPRTLEDYRSALENNLEQYERLRSMVQSLLFIARAENAEAVLNRRPTDLGAIASEVCDFFSAVAEEREITLRAEGSATVSVDDVLLRMALSNLISNGLRHTRAGGAGNVVVKLAEGGAQIIVRDTGAGICEEHLPHVFDRFYRVDESRATSEGGTGLGLAIVRSVAALHGGSARVESQVGEGTAFHLFFPNPQVER
jgi:two-component system heavy metal sensor histidine kinase CusS